jgi:hypothetical protein
MAEIRLSELLLDSFPAAIGSEMRAEIRTRLDSPPDEMRRDVKDTVVPVAFVIPGDVPAKIPAWEIAPMSASME